MTVGVPLSLNTLKNVSSVNELREFYINYYNNDSRFTIHDSRIKVLNQGEGTNKFGMLNVNRLKLSDNMEIMVEGSEQNLTLYATYDNLGKGASGAAVQCLDIMLLN
jgi:N-acetyl-gamma-glutamyl-phosphate reductase